MVFLRNTEHGQVWFHEIESVASWEDPPFSLKPYVCLVVIAESILSGDEEMSLCRMILKSGSTYVCCAGIDCSRWHDSFDWAAMDVMKPLDSDPVLTTWHETDSVEQIVDYFLRCTAFGASYEHFLLVFVGRDEQLKQNYLKSVAAYHAEWWQELSSSETQPAGSDNQIRRHHLADKNDDHRGEQNSR